MEAEQSQNFNERLSRWVASQGFWFQIRYSMAGSGTKGTALFHLLRMGARLLVFLLILAIGVFVYLVKRTDFSSFSEKLKVSLKAGLSAEELEMGGASHSHGELTISRFVCEGGDKTFYATMSARNVHMRLGLLDGVTQSWDTGTVFASGLEMDLHAGTDDAESAAAFGDALFRQSADVKVALLDIADTSIRWGYSDPTRGAISNSHLIARRSGDTLRLDFKGGTFTQNWLRKLEIVELTVVCNREGFEFTKAEFRRGSGTVDLTGLKLVAGERPTVSGMAKVRMLGLDSALPPAARAFLEGTMSGAFAVSGSTNGSDGIGFDGKVVLDGQDTIILRNRLHLLKALSDVDFVRNYKRIDFREGSFGMKTTGGGMKIEDLQLKSDDAITLKGGMIVRLPTPEEARTAILKGETEDNVTDYSMADDVPGDSGSESDFTLRRAALEAKRLSEGGGSPDPGSLFNRLGLSIEMRRLEALAAERASQSLRYEGEFTITLPADAFEEAPKLAKDYPIDTETGRIPIKVPISGSLFEITLEQTKTIYERGRR